MAAYDTYAGLPLSMGSEGYRSLSVYLSLRRINKSGWMNLMRGAHPMTIHVAILTSLFAEREESALTSGA